MSISKTANISLMIYRLVGGFNHFLFSIIYGMSSFPLTISIIFQDGYCTTNQSSEKGDDTKKKWEQPRASVVRIR